jgi:hypothetical protein
MAQLLRKMNLDLIFSKSRSGTITHKNKKKYGRHPMAIHFALKIISVGPLLMTSKYTDVVP